VLQHQTNALAVSEACPSISFSEGADLLSSLRVRVVAGIDTVTMRGVRKNAQQGVLRIVSGRALERLVYGTLDPRLLRLSGAGSERHRSYRSSSIEPSAASRFRSSIFFMRILQLPECSTRR